MAANLEKSAVDTWVENVFFFDSNLKERQYQGKWKWKSESESDSVESDSLQPHGLYSP